MKIELVNIGMIEEAEVDLEKLTIIAGKNGTGKSTIGKVLDVAINKIISYEDDLHKEMQEKVSEILEDLEKRVKNTDIWFSEVVDETIDGDFGNWPFENDFEVDVIENYWKRFVKLPYKIEELSEQFEINLKKYELDSDVNETIEKILEIVKTSKDKKIINSLFMRSFEEEFYGQMKTIGKEEGRIRISYDGNSIFDLKIEDKNYSIEQLKEAYSKQITYVDSPFIIDDLRVPVRRRGKRDRELLVKLRRATSGKLNVFDEERTTKLLERINILINGEFTRKNNNYYLVKKEGEIRIENLATGIKSLLLLFQLIKSPALDKDNILILDEPEVHLHPEWQIKYAEIIILLCKELDVKVLVTSHSPYFIEALKVYSDKHLESKDVNYYLAEKNEIYSKIIKKRNVSELLEQLIKPFDILDEEFIEDIYG